MIDRTRRLIVGFMVRLRRVADPGRRPHAYWTSVVLTISAVMIGFGTPYAIGGLSATSVPGAYAAIQHLPGGQHFYGAVMLAIGLALAYSQSPLMHHRRMYWALSMICLGLTAGFAVGAIIGFGLSMSQTGTLTWQAMIYWGSVASLSIASIALAPDPTP